MTELVATVPVVVAEGVCRTYGSGSRAVRALRGVSLAARPGELVAVRGRSGSGKTTLLNIIGGLDRPDDGRILVAGQEISTLGDQALARLRRETVGFVFQSFGLLPILSAAENIGVPMRLVGADPAAREERVAELLAMVGLSEHAAQRPYELSGGQQQRVAIARALANRPRVLLADEPTGQLDSHTGRTIVQLLRSIVHGEQVTAVLATHDPALLELADTVYELRDGTLVWG